MRTKSNGAKAIIMEVENSGPGIEAERLSDIFEAFVTTKPHGTGLGLAICSRIIERHGGRLTASSDGKNGSIPNRSAGRADVQGRRPRRVGYCRVMGARCPLLAQSGHERRAR